MSRFATMDEYADSLDITGRDRLSSIRASVRREVPEAQEIISYNIPAFRCGKTTFLFAGCWTSHLGLYPIAAGDTAFEAALRPYRSTKATVRLPHDQPLPEPLLTALIRSQHAHFCTQCRSHT